MGLFNKIKDLLNQDLMAFIRTDTVSSPDEKKKDVSEIYFRGAWQEDGVAKWAFFKAEEKENYSTKRLEKELVIDDKPVEPPPSEKIDVPPADIVKESEEVCSITEMGRSMTSRYTSSSEAPVSGLVDQREFGNTGKIKVFFAEDNRGFQIILKTLINKSEEMEFLGWAGDGQEAVNKIKNLDTYPDVILMDIAMPKMDGITATKELLKFNPDTRVIMLTAFGDKEHVVSAFDGGAVGFLRKDAGLPLIREAIKQAARGGRPVHKEVSQYLKDDSMDGDEKKDFTEVSSEEKVLPPPVIPAGYINKYNDKTGNIQNKVETTEEKDLNILISEENNFSQSDILEKISSYRSSLRSNPEKINDIIASYLKLQRNYPDVPEIYIALSCTYMKKGMFKEGMTELIKTISSDFLDKKSSFIEKIL